MKALVIATVLAGLVASQSFAQGEPDMLMPKAKIRGVVLLQDGETPVNNLRVRVWDAQTEEIVFKTKTNDDGLFEVPDFENSGNYYVTVGPVKVDLAILAARGPVPQHNGFVMVMPKRMPLLQTLVPTSLSAAAAPALTQAPEIVSP